MLIDCRCCAPGTKDAYAKRLRKTRLVSHTAVVIAIQSSHGYRRTVPTINATSWPGSVLSESASSPTGIVTDIRPYKTHCCEFVLLSGLWSAPACSPHFSFLRHFCLKLLWLLLALYSKPTAKWAPNARCNVELGRPENADWLAPLSTYRMVDGYFRRRIREKSYSAKNAAQSWNAHLRCLSLTRPA